MGWISGPDPRSGGQSSGQGHALSRIPSPTPHPPSPTNSAVIVELGERGGTILTLSDSKLNLSLLSRHSLLTPKAKAEAGGILLGGKAQGVTFGQGGAGLWRSPPASQTRGAPGWGRAEGLRVGPLSGAKPGAAEEGSPPRPRGWAKRVSPPARRGLARPREPLPGPVGNRRRP